jgi:hypothetical protein
VLTGSTGKTFSGLQGGVIAYSRLEHDRLIRPLTFPTLATTHQVNRVAALAIAAAEMPEFPPRLDDPDRRQFAGARRGAGGAQLHAPRRP